MLYYILMAAFFASSDSGISAPEPLEQQYQLYLRELGEGTLDRLLLQLSVISSSIQVSLTSPTSAQSHDQQHSMILCPRPACAGLF